MSKTNTTPQRPLASGHSPIEDLVADIRAGKLVVVVDDADRENEGDLICAAEAATDENINFMLTHGRGLVCVPLLQADVERLGLGMMRERGHDGSPISTAFTESVDARAGTTTGISAGERANTIRVLADPETKPDDLMVPGHMFPLRAHADGVLGRRGHTEAAIDLARLAGMRPAGVLCEILNEDGTMAREADLLEFCRKHDLKLGSIADLYAYCEAERDAPNSQPAPEDT